ncbi:hypothetical protein HMPREF2734_01285 [Corynebacterium sp. HMSC055D05]|nr:hypothetical protein HMPREF2734_01285 [Corynebacterium sp. HMSC055D05]
MRVALNPLGARSVSQFLSEIPGNIVEDGVTEPKRDIIFAFFQQGKISVNNLVIIPFALPPTTLNKRIFLGSGAIKVKSV